MVQKNTKKTGERSTRFIFLLLLVISMYVVINSRSYNRYLFCYKLAQATQWFTDLKTYLNLKQQNKDLFEENIRLSDLVGRLKQHLPPDVMEANVMDKNSIYVSGARVIKNSYLRKHNYMILDKGLNDGIQQGMGVGNEHGILGIVSHVSKEFSAVISLLNKKVRVSVRLKETDHFGTLVWRGKDYRYLDLKDIPQTAPVNVGDTIITSGYSLIFPKGIDVGVVSNIETDYSGNYQNLEVRLFNDMTNLSHVYIFRYPNRMEIEELLEKIRP